MAFTDSEIAEHTLTIEKHFWAKRRPPVEMRDQIREGQRFTDQNVDLFYVRPRFMHPEETIDSPIARMRYIRSRRRWQLYWMRADLKWHRYVPYPTALTLEEALRAIDEDPHGCFFG
jgi:hypothetical protein